MTEQQTVFEGSDAIKNYLNPSNHPYTPMVEIKVPENLKGKKIRIFAKLMNSTPLGNVKSIIAYNMIKDASENGTLKGVHTLVVESSSGNTAFSLACVGSAFGIQNTKAIVSHEVLEGKLQLLRLFGTQVQVIEEPICPDPEDKESGIYKAKQQGMKLGYFNPSQYDNPSNPRSHENLTGKQVWEQTKGNVTVFCAGLGTTGTMVGSARFLKRENNKICTVGVVRTPNNPVPGPRTASLLKMIAFEWKDYVDHLVEIGTIASFENSINLIRSGIFVGPSSGFALAGLLSFLERNLELGTLEQLRNNDGKVICVFVCCDSPLPYLKEYFEYLDDRFFPNIENENLLLYKKQKISPKLYKDELKIMISPRAAFRQIFMNSEDEVWEHLRQGKDVVPAKNVIIIDIRLPVEFWHFHIPGSINFNFITPTTELINSLKGKKTYVVCNFGSLSYAFAKSLNENGVEAFNITGGMIEWSNMNLPRWRPEVCKN
ncbi:MAG: pyridoxal-phosphate dependent enzyme [Candidatus Marsarchaeota archaeon]|nr:pyridoxal-phosphate dependent enzyme [Candidatus Marsarchaeota archaeon]